MAPPAPVSCNHGLGACRFQAWCRQRRQIDAAEALRYHCLLPGHSGAAAPPYLARAPCCRCCRRLCCPRSLRWWGGSVPSPPPSVLLRQSVALSVHSGVFISPGQCFHSGGVNALRRLDPPSQSLAVPPGVFRHSAGLAASSVSPHSGGLGRHSVGLADLPSASHSIGLACRVFLLAGNPLPCRGSCPMAASRSCLVGGCEGGIPGFAPAGLPGFAAPPTPLPRSLPPPSSPIPCHPCRSTRLFRLRSLPCLFPTCGTPPLLRCCLPACVPFRSINRAPVPPLLSSLPSCSFLPLLRLSLPLLCPCSSPLLCRPHPTQ